MTKEKKIPNKRKKPSRKSIVTKLDAIFSKYIRLRNAKGGIATCYTCGKKDHWKKLQNGHFMSRRHYSTRWDETNCQVQCYGCNVGMQGNQYIFGMKLNADHGECTSEELMHQSRQIRKFTDAELLEMIEHYKKLVNKLNG